MLTKEDANTMDRILSKKEQLESYGFDVEITILQPQFRFYRYILLKTTPYRGTPYTRDYLTFRLVEQELDRLVFDLEVQAPVHQG